MPQVFDNGERQTRLKISVLSKRRDFLRIAATQKKWVSKSMIVQQAPMPDSAMPDSAMPDSAMPDSAMPDLNVPDGPNVRVGYTASKKVGNAVKRNRAKRRLREVVRAVLPSMVGRDGGMGYDYVLIARSETVDKPYDELIRDFKWCLKRLNQPNDREISSKESIKYQKIPNKSRTCLENIVPPTVKK